MTKDEYAARHFPNVECGARPVGNQILVQLRTMEKMTKGGIILAEETVDFNESNTQVARLVKQGQIAFRNRETGDTWKEGAWAEIGDIVVMPKFGGFRFSVQIPGTENVATFSLFDDYHVKLVIEDNFESFDQIL
jgi:co-chaperonin GroES (HSP10)